MRASITNSFSTSIFRFGHGQVSDATLLVTSQGETVGSLTIQDGFFNPWFLRDDPANVERVLKGLASQAGQEIDLPIVDGVRNSLFGASGAGGLDLAALDIQRGRDHGLPDYNALRAFYGLPRVTSFDEVSSDPQVRAKLAAVYNTVDNVDSFVGALAEDHLPGSSVGALVDRVNALLVASTGTGRISAYHRDTGSYLGQLSDGAGDPVDIDGLWGLLDAGGDVLA